MKYISTRGGMQPVPFLDILLEGLAPDGGLAIPQTYPQVGESQLSAWRELSYADLAIQVIGRFADDIAPEVLSELIGKTYTAEIFGSDEITPLTELEPGLHLLGLSNGPTLAFKDIAMQLLGNLFEYALAQRKHELNIVGATSGDTGSAAEYAMRSKRGIRVFMLSPLGKMSAFQTAQMFSLADENIFNLAVEGVFDDAQDLVKAISKDADFKSRYRIGTVNSINWARIVAQVVYYFKAYFAATDSNRQQASFAVPSGNFGNICAGHIARMMGLPIAQLVCATNENDVLDEFFRTGQYRSRTSAQVHHTSSPSMDISKASNFERFIYDLVGQDPVRVVQLWKELESGGGFDLSGDQAFRELSTRFGFVSGSSTHADRVATIRAVYRDSGRVIDPHTADALKVARQYCQPGIPMIVLETALPAKFADTIVEALGRQPERPEVYRDIELRKQHFTVMRASVAELRAFIAAHARSRELAP